MTKVYVDAGHGGSDPGAVKYVIERDVNLVIANACNEYLEKHGVSTKMSRTSNSTGTDINSMAASANRWGADLVISIHNNAGSGDGFEVYHTINGGTGKTLAKNIETEVKKIGQNSRGLKTRKNASGTDYYGMIRLTNAPAVICEGFFVDNKTDVKIADTKAEQQAFGDAYARGILKTLGISDKGAPSGGTSSSSKPSGGTSSKRTIASVYDADAPLTVKQAVKAGQAISNIILGTKIAEDGVRGANTEKNAVKILQWAMNKDYNAGLDVDGIFGSKSKKALGDHTVRLNEVQYMVTALEVLLLLAGYNPHGVELPGEFGSGCRKATGQFQRDAKLTVDYIAGKKTFKKLIK